MGEQVIVLTELTKQYGKFTAVDHIRLSIRKGEIFGLLGPNGAVYIRFSGPVMSS